MTAKIPARLAGIPKPVLLKAARHYADYGDLTLQSGYRQLLVFTPRQLAQVVEFHSGVVGG